MYLREHPRESELTREQRIVAAAAVNRFIEDQGVAGTAVATADNLHYFTVETVLNSLAFVLDAKMLNEDGKFQALSAYELIQEK